jgi:hypothetical protein
VCAVVRAAANVHAKSVHVKMAGAHTMTTLASTLPTVMPTVMPN